MKSYLLIAVALVAGPVANAQQAMTSDQLINLLKPSASGPTRGIHAIVPAPAAIGSAMPVAARTNVMAHQVAPRSDAAASSGGAVASSGDLASVDINVQFENGSDRLKPAAIKTLDTLGRALSSATLASYRFRIVGHTDAVGSHDANAALSARRADTVADYISTHYGVDRSRLTSVGMGDSHMLIATPAGVAEPRNRRVEIVNAGS